MSRFHWLCAIALTTGLTACGPATTSTGMTTDDANISIVPTVFASTASVGTVEPVFVTVLPGQEVTPATSVHPTPTLIPPLPGGLAPTELKYRVLVEFPDFFFCDPDYYPVARADEIDVARQRFPELQANAEEFATILAHNNLTGLTDFSDDQKLLIYREHKRLAAIQFVLIDAGYQFQIQVAKTEGNGEGITGVIDSQGTITIQDRKASIATCPICLAAGTFIDTPNGPVAVQNLRVAMLVWTVDKAGARVALPVIQVSKTVVPTTHRVVFLVLSDGRELHVSPGHPTTDGRTVGQLRAGDWFDGAIVRSAERVPYTELATYDLLPAGETGFYWANGILIASTLGFKPD